MIDGVASNPFSARGLPPLRHDEETGNEEAVINYTRNHYAGSREAVEQAIATWHEDEIANVQVKPGAVVDDKHKTIPQDRVAPSGDGRQVECDSCGQLTTINFEPDGVRPVFCRQCLAKSKEERKLQLDSRKKAKERELASLAASEQSAPAGPELSLSDLAKAAPVDFKGKRLPSEERK